MELERLVLGEGAGRMRGPQGERQPSQRFRHQVRPFDPCRAPESGRNYRPIASRHGGAFGNALCSFCGGALDLLHAAPSAASIASPRRAVMVSISSALTMNGGAIRTWS